MGLLSLERTTDNSTQQSYHLFTVQGYIHAHELRSIIEEFGVGDGMTDLISQLEELALPDRCKVSLSQGSFSLSPTCLCTAAIRAWKPAHSCLALL